MILIYVYSGFASEPQPQHFVLPNFAQHFAALYLTKVGGQDRRAANVITQKRVEHVWRPSNPMGGVPVHM